VGIGAFVIAVILFAVAIVAHDSGWAVTAATVVLAAATVLVALHTSNLATATDQLRVATSSLAAIEQKRDLRVRMQEAIHTMRDIRNAQADVLVVEQLAHGRTDHSHFEPIRRLRYYENFLDESSRLKLNEIVQVIHDTDQGRFNLNEDARFRIRDSQLWIQKVTAFQAGLAGPIADLETRLAKG
jgi:hypothetical protein